MQIVLTYFLIQQKRYDVSMEVPSFSKSVESKLKKEFEVYSPVKSACYSHPTFVINNLADYIRIVSKIASLTENDKFDFFDTVVYRGMVDVDFELLPGLARVKKAIPDMEETIINDYLIRRPDAFSGLSEFDALAKMQHYGLPTRLLDFTLNPLVALFFACESQTRKDGRVVCHGTILQNDSSDYVNALCISAMKKPFDSAYTIEEYLCNDRLTLKKYLMNAYFYQETTVVRPKYWNQRIANQAGVFMMFPNNIVDRYGFILTHITSLGVDQAIADYGRDSINANAVKMACETEPILYYEKQNDFFVTDDIIQKMYEAYKSSGNSALFWDVCKSRFRITDTIKPLSPLKLKNSFCSIIIEARNKRKILKDLSYIGFGVDYIYPELEYTAKEIKRRLE